MEKCLDKKWDIDNVNIRKLEHTQIDKYEDRGISVQEFMFALPKEYIHFTEE